jgi:hypothetical protein
LYFSEFPQDDTGEIVSEETAATPNGCPPDAIVEMIEVHADVISAAPPPFREDAAGDNKEDVHPSAADDALEADDAKDEGAEDKDDEEDNGDGGKDTEGEESSSTTPTIDLASRFEEFKSSMKLEVFDGWGFQDVRASDKVLHAWVSDGFYDYIIKKACDAAFIDGDWLLMSEPSFVHYISDLAPPAQNVVNLIKVSNTNA